MRVDEMGAPLQFARDAQVWAGRRTSRPRSPRSRTTSSRSSAATPGWSAKAIGVVGLITPWNWPFNQIVCKVAPALAAGCTMVLKPSEIAPLSGVVFAEIMHAAGVPPGVFNLVNGDGPTVGQALALHPGRRHDVLHRFDARRRHGREDRRRHGQARHQELGGKSANIILPDADLEKAVRQGVRSLLQQHRAVLRCADAHAGAARAARRGAGRGKAGGGQARQGGRSAQRRTRNSAPWSARRSSTRSSA